MILDIIVPHYNEPWQEVRKLFDMLALQRAVDFSDFRVILVNDGDQCPIMEQILRSRYPYEVIGLPIPHGGVSAARNRGLEFSRAEWVMFCDCDDTFASVYAIRSILDVLDTQEYDLLWMPFYIECSHKQNRQIKNGYNALFIHGKVFRREFLIRRGLRFPTELDYSEDTAFLAVVGMEVAVGRVGEIKCEAPMYIWTYRPGSATTDLARAYHNAVTLFRRQLYVRDQYLRRGMQHEAEQVGIRALCDAYVTLHRQDITEDRSGFQQQVLRFYREGGRQISIDAETLGKAMAGAITEAGIGKETLPDVSGFYEWITKLSEVMENAGD